MPFSNLLPDLSVEKWGKDYFADFLQMKETFSNNFSGLGFTIMTRDGFCEIIVQVSPGAGGGGASLVRQSCHFLYKMLFRSKTHADFAKPIEKNLNQSEPNSVSIQTNLICFGLDANWPNLVLGSGFLNISSSALHMYIAVSPYALEQFCRKKGGRRKG